MNNILENITAFCVLLDKRIEFWPELESQFKSVGINLKGLLVGKEKINHEYFHHDVNEKPPIYDTTNQYPSWVNGTNAFNAWISHKKILRFAYHANLDKVMIIEDDVKIEPDFNEIMEDVNRFFDNRSFDILQFGGYHHNNTTKVSEHVVKTKASGGWHGVIISKSVIPLLLSFEPIGPFDWICEQFIQPKYDCYCIHPGIINQKDGFSFVENSNLTKPDRYSL